MLILFDFACLECSHDFETLAEKDEYHVICPDCGGKAIRSLQTPRIKLDGCDPGFPTAYSQWADKHEKAAREARRKEDDG